MPGPKKIPPRVRKTSGKKPSSTAKFEALLKRSPPDGRYELLLYVTGNSPLSIRAIANVRSLCDEYLAGRYSLEVVDIYQQPARAATDEIIAAPTLVKRHPLPPKRLIGDLSDRARLIVALNLTADGSSPPVPHTHWIKL